METIIIIGLILFAITRYEAWQARRDWKIVKQAMRRFPDNDDVSLRKE